MLVLIAVPLLSWLAALAVTMRWPRMTLWLLLAGVGAVAFWLATSSNDQQWAAPIWLAMVGAVGGVVGPGIVRDDRLIAVGLSAIAGPIIAFGGLHMMAVAGCMWSGQCM